MRTTSSRRLLAALAISALASTACGSAAEVQDPGFERIREAATTSTEALPSPVGDVVLELSGALPASKTPLTFDMAALESLGLVEYAVDDPQAEGRVVTFRGVLLRDLLEFAGVGEGATLHTVALNDYAVDIPASDAFDSPVLIATSVDGASMPVDRFGPLRIVYPYASHELDPTIHDPRWIWQLAAIDVR